MTYKVLKNSEGSFAVQYKYKYWPFWFWLTHDVGANDTPVTMLFSTVETAIGYMQSREHAKKEEKLKKEWTQVWP